MANGLYQALHLVVQESQAEPEISNYLQKEQEMKCTSCNHAAVCLFRSKLNTLVNNHSHLFRSGSYAAANSFADVCGLYNRTEPVRLADCERQCILAAMVHCSNNKVAAATLLGIGGRTLYRKLSQYKED